MGCGCNKRKTLSEIKNMNKPIETFSTIQNEIIFIITIICLLILIYIMKRNKIL